MMNGRIFSGVQPTGNLHLGNYLGAIKQWVALQNDYECIFSIVDLHAITVKQDPDALADNTRNMAAAYIAAGIDPKQTIIYPQSSVTGHSELAWILGCMTPLGWLNRMTQFKDKAGKNKDQAVLGLYGYPVLMAADILLYRATHVPVGEDQKQHLELAREIAGAYNRYTGTDYFVLPEPLILGPATRVMSLKDGRQKMSKSDPSDNARINLTDDAEAIRHKFKKAKSDMESGISYDVEKRPEASNLLTIYAALADRTVEDVAAEFKDASFSEFKTSLAEIAVETLGPVTEKMQALKKDKDYLDDVLREGSRRAESLCAPIRDVVKSSLGFIRYS